MARAAMPIVESFTAPVRRAAAEAVKSWPVVGSTVAAGAVNLLVAYTVMLAKPAACPSLSDLARFVASVLWWSAGLAAAGPWLLCTRVAAAGGWTGATRTAPAAPGGSRRMLE